MTAPDDHFADFHYNYIKRNFDAELLFTGTDSLTYEIETEDIYEDFFRDKHLFDFNDYLKDSKFYNVINKKVIDKIKDEFRSSVIITFVGLKSKIYFISAEDSKKWKRINKNVVEKIGDEVCEDVLFNNKIMRHKMKRI